MAKNSIRDFSATAGSNTDIQSVNIDENCPASGINNAIRELMVDLKNVSTGAVNLETPGADQLNVDNLRLDGNTISSTDTNGDITLDPNGTGNVVVGDGGADNRTTFNPSSAFAIGVKNGSNHGGFIGSNGSSGMQFSSSGGAARMTIDSGGNVLAISGTIGGLGSYNNTTSAAANVNILSSGVLVRSTSSRRYKNTITDATHGLTELLALRPVTYKGNNDGDTIFGGLIAEEVHDAGLTEFVTYNDDNEPDALAYGNMVSLCIKAIQEQQTTIKSLEQRIAALEA